VPSRGPDERIGHEVHDQLGEKGVERNGRRTERLGASTGDVRARKSGAACVDEGLGRVDADARPPRSLRPGPRVRFWWRRCEACEAGLVRGAAARARAGVAARQPQARCCSGERTALSGGAETRGVRQTAGLGGSAPARRCRGARVNLGRCGWCACEVSRKWSLSGAVPSAIDRAAVGRWPVSHPRTASRSGARDDAARPCPCSRSRWPALRAGAIRVSHAAACVCATASSSRANARSRAAARRTRAGSEVMRATNMCSQS
jgi:hypothetical protein